MKTKLKLPTPMIVAAMVMLCPAKSYSQYEKEGQIFIPSPDVWSFMKYGNTPTDLYRGIAQTQIPIYTYKDKDFELPISIDYASSGFIPNVQTGVLGLGWFLNAGGTITREVRGVPDDRMPAIDDPNQIWGYSYYSDSNFGLDSPKNPDELMEKIRLDPSKGYNYIDYKISQGRSLETTSDIYHFKFGDHSGSFMLDGPENKIHVFAANHPNGEYNIDITELRESYDNNKSKISITTGDGYIYVFGDHNYSCLVGTTKDKNGRNDTYAEPNNFKALNDYPLSFMLTNIIAPNGRTINFEYHVPGGASGLSVEERFDFCRPWAYIERSVRITPTFPPSFGPTSHEVRIGKQYGIRLKKINIDGKVSIDINYDMNKEKEWYKLNGNHIASMENNLGLIDGITVTNGLHQEILNCNFSYSTSPAHRMYGTTPTSNPVTFLDGLTISGQGRYTFDYYDKDKSFPFHGTSSIDHWGYYNGNGQRNDSYDSEDLIPLFSKNTPGYGGVTITSNEREPSYDGTVMGMLKLIKYPTGGMTKFEYGLNSYTRKVIKELDMFGGRPRLVGKDERGGYQSYTNMDSNPAGGVHIKKITDYSDSVTVSTERTFSYNSYANISGSINSGILLHHPTYYHETFLSSTEGNDNYGDLYIWEFSGSSLLALSMDSYHIGYSVVRESFLNGSYTDHYFRNYAEDIQDLPQDHFYNGAYLIDVAKRSGPWWREPISHHNDRGKPKASKSCDSLGRPVQEIAYIYADLVLQENPIKKYSECISLSSKHWAYKQRTLVSEYPLVEKRVTDYVPGGSIVTSDNYEYNDAGQTTKIVNSRTGIDDIYTTHLSYLSTDDKVYQYPETTVRTHKSGTSGTEKIIDAQKINYQNIGTTSAPMYKPTTIRRAYLSPNLTFNNLSSNLETEITNSYDTFGKLKQQTDRNGIPTSYIWGYGGLYPVAVVQNASSSAVASKVPTPPSMALSTTQDAALRTLPGASVTTYKHKPFVGVTEIRDNSGRVVTYTYDIFGRLDSVIDSDGNLVNKYTYNISLPGQGNGGPSGTSTNHNFILTNTYIGTDANDYVADVDYYNGLGDLSQRVSVGASPKEGRSIVTPVYYDEMRRESRQYLPYVTTAAGSAAYDPAAITGANNQQAFYNNGAFDTADAQRAYTENIYEPSPLNRVAAAFNAGSVFRAPGNEKMSTFAYGANTSGDGVKRFRLSGSQTAPLTVASYPVNTLHKTTTTNEDGATTFTFTDMSGRTVLERVASDGAGRDNIDTYYVYDDCGNLCYVLPPELSAKADVNDHLDEFAYSYVYDGRNRCIEKRLPGAEPVYMVYDRGDRVVMTQDGNQRPTILTQQRWLFNRYDNLNRLVSQSLVTNTGGVSLTALRRHFEGANSDLPSDFTTVAVLVENTYSE